MANPRPNMSTPHLILDPDHPEGRLPIPTALLRASELSLYLDVDSIYNPGMSGMVIEPSLELNGQIIYNFPGISPFPVDQGGRFALNLKTWRARSMQAEPSGSYQLLLRLRLLAEPTAPVRLHVQPLTR